MFFFLFSFFPKIFLSLHSITLCSDQSTKWSSSCFIKSWCKASLTSTQLTSWFSKFLFSLCALFNSSSVLACSTLLSSCSTFRSLQRTLSYNSSPSFFKFEQTSRGLYNSNSNCCTLSSLSPGIGKDFSFCLTPHLLLIQVQHVWPTILKSLARISRFSHLVMTSNNRDCMYCFCAQQMLSSLADSWALTANSQLTCLVGSCYVVLALAAYKTPLPTVLLLLCVYLLPL